MEYEKITPMKLAKLLKKHNAPITIEFAGDTIQNVRIAIGDTHFKIAISSYSVELQMPKQVTTYVVSTEVEGLPLSKTFGSEEEAEDFAKKLIDKYETAGEDLNVNVEEVTNYVSDQFVPVTSDQKALCS